MSQAMSKEEIEAKAKEIFGEDAEVYYSNTQWIIETKIEEKFDPEPWSGTPAFEAYAEYEGSYGSAASGLHRWLKDSKCTTLR